VEGRERQCRREEVDAEWMMAARLLPQTPYTFNTIQEASTRVLLLLPLRPP
jgi:formylglycine-generating enzyme required for sulfatase activity